MNKWSDLQKRFMEIIYRLPEGPTKTTTGYLIVSQSYGPYSTIGKPFSVVLGGYDIGSWDRHEDVGDFFSENEAYEATVLKINEAERIVMEEIGHED